MVLCTAQLFFPCAFYLFTPHFFHTGSSMLSSLMWNYHPSFACWAHQNPQNPYRPPSMLPALSSLKPSTSLISHRALAHSGITPRSSKDAVSPSHLQISSQEKLFGSQEKAAGQSTAWNPGQDRVSLTFPLPWSRQPHKQGILSCTLEFCKNRNLL